MKKISKLVGLTLAALAIMLTGCRKSTGSSTPIEKEEIPADAMRNFTDDSKESDWGIYGVEDLEKLSEVVNGGNNFKGMTVTVKKDIVINKKVLSADYLEPEEGPDATPTPGLKNLNSIGTGKTLVDDGDSAEKDFCGTFDGNGKIISGLYMYQGHQGLGLIGCANDAVIKNVILVDACVINKNVQRDEEAKYPPHDGYDDDRFGGIVGLVKSDGVTIENCLFAGVLGSQAAINHGADLEKNPYEYIGALVGRCTAESEAKDSFAFARIYGSHENVICGRESENLDQKNVTGVEIDSNTNFEDLAAQIEEAIAAVKANLQ